MQFKTSLCLFCLSLFFTLSQAQNPHQQLFKLTDQQIELLLRKPNMRLYLPGDEIGKKRFALQLANPIQRFQKGSLFPLKDQPPGTYFLTTVERGAIVGEMMIKSEINDIRILTEAKQGWIQVVADQPIAEMAAFFNQKKVPFDAQKQAFRLKGKPKNGILHIRTAQESRFFRITMESLIKSKSSTSTTPMAITWLRPIPLLKGNTTATNC